MAKKEKLKTISCAFRIDESIKKRIERIEEATSMKFPMANVLRKAILKELDNLETVFDVKK